MIARNNLNVFAFVVTMLACAGTAQAGYVYVGHWAVADGPDWWTNPQVMTGQETAAYLFGGDASDYAISTIDNDPTHINFLTFLDGWGDVQYLVNPAAQNYSLSSNGGGYDTRPAFSAYVSDHVDNSKVNYAFRVDDVPAPATLALMGMGLAGVGFKRRRKAA